MFAFSGIHFQLRSHIEHSNEPTLSGTIPLQITFAHYHAIKKPRFIDAHVDLGLLMIKSRHDALTVSWSVQ